MSDYSAFPMSHDAEDPDLVLVWGILPPDDGDALSLDFASEEEAAAVAAVIGRIYREGHYAGVSKACDEIEEFARKLVRGG